MHGRDIKNPLVYVVDSISFSIKYYKLIIKVNPYSFEYVDQHKVDYIKDNIVYSTEENRLYIG